MVVDGFETEPSSFFQGKLELIFFTIHISFGGWYGSSLALVGFGYTICQHFFPVSPSLYEMGFFFFPPFGRLHLCPRFFFVLEISSLFEFLLKTVSLSPMTF